MPPDDDFPDSWTSREEDLFESWTDRAGLDYDPGDDQWLEFLYHEVLWDFDISADLRHGAYDELMQYVWDEYGIDFEELYDWEGYREAYDSA